MYKLIQGYFSVGKNLRDILKLIGIAQKRSKFISMGNVKIMKAV